MKKLLFLLFVGAVAFVLISAPIIVGWGSKKVAAEIGQLETIPLSGKTLFLSDLHLIFMPIEEQFNLDFSDVKNVVIVGDFFNTPMDFDRFGDSEEESLRSVLVDLVPEGFTGDIFFVYGRPHDPILSEVTKLSFENYNFHYLGEYGKFDVDGTPVLVMHGQQMFWGIVGGGISWLGQKVGQPLPLERIGRKRFGISEDTWFVTGHSHVPALHGESKTANAGSFVGAPFNKYIFRIHIGTGILFDDGQVELLEFQDLNIKNLYPFAI